MVKRKLDSLEIELEDEKYTIGVFEDNKFRLITIDDDSTGDSIHYFRLLQLTLIEDSKAVTLMGILAFVVLFLIVFILFILAIELLIK